jgi:hypothetical protein
MILCEPTRLNRSFTFSRILLARKFFPPACLIFSKLALCVRLCFLRLDLSASRFDYFVDESTHISVYMRLDVIGARIHFSDRKDSILSNATPIDRPIFGHIVVRPAFSGFSEETPSPPRSIGS